MALSSTALVYVVTTVMAILIAAVILVLAAGRKGVGDHSSDYDKTTRFIKVRRLWQAHKFPHVFEVWHRPESPSDVWTPSDPNPTSATSQLGNVRNLFGQLIDSVIVIYSLVILASFLPTLRVISDILLVPYYLVIPGYVLSGLIAEDTSITSRAFSSVIWSLALVVSIFSIQTIVPGSRDLPIGLFVSLLTLLFLAYNLLHGRST